MQTDAMPATRALCRWSWRELAVLTDPRVIATIVAYIDTQTTRALDPRLRSISARPEGKARRLLAQLDERCWNDGLELANTLGVPPPA